jgi:hypothetical protein
MSFLLGPPTFARFTSYGSASHAGISNVERVKALARKTQSAKSGLAQIAGIMFALRATAPQILVAKRAAIGQDISHTEFAHCWMGRATLYRRSLELEVTAMSYRPLARATGRTRVPRWALDGQAPAAFCRGPFHVSRFLEACGASSRFATINGGLPYLIANPPSK